MTRVLAFDLAAKTGWAANQPDLEGEYAAPPLIGHFVIDEDSSPNGPCFLELERQVALLIEKVLPDLVAFEAPLPIAAFANMMKKKDTLRVPVTVTTAHVRKTYGYAAIVEKVCTQYGLDAIPVNVQQARGYFMGNRYAEKETVRVRCLAMKWPVTTLDEADACCAWAYTHSRLRVLDLKNLIEEAEARAGE